MQSEMIDKLATSLSKAQGIIENAKKDVENTFFKTKYADLASVWDAIRKPLSDNGLSVVQGCNENDHLVTTLMHSSGQFISSVTPIFNGKKDAQGFGSGMTYARRYALSAIVGITQDDDDGNNASQKHDVNNDASSKDAREKRIIALISGCHADGMTDDQITRILGTTHWYGCVDAKYHELSNARP